MRVRELTLSVWNRVYIVVVMVLLGTVAYMTPIYSAFAQQSDTSTNAIRAFPTYLKLFGNTYGEWTSKWWQWALSISTGKNPLEDKTGANCPIGQNGPVWFLAGTFGGSADRTCNVPPGKAIMFPVYNAECSYAEYPQYKTESELRNCAKDQADKVTGLDASIDGIVIDNLKQKYRVQSPLFDFILPNNNVLGTSAGPSKAVSDGYWVILQPLSPGKHDVRFSGSAVDFTSTAPMNFATAVKYHLDVSK
jgi:hypothetical protein